MNDYLDSMRESKTVEHSQNEIERVKKMNESIAKQFAQELQNQIPLGGYGQFSKAAFKKKTFSFDRATVAKGPTLQTKQESSKNLKLNLEEEPKEIQIIGYDNVATSKIKQLNQKQQP